MTTTATTLTKPTDWIAALRGAEEALPTDVHDGILALGKKAVPALIKILEDEELALEVAPGDGWAPIHAVDLLVELQAVDAIEPMLSILELSDWEDILWNRVVVRLSDLGAPVVEPIFRRIGPQLDDPTRDAFCEVMARVGVQEERIFRELCLLFERDQGGGALAFATYRDPRAVPLLQNAIAEFEPNWEDPDALLDLNDLVDGYVELAGELPEELEASVREIYAERDRRWPLSSEPLVLGPKIGRNDPCPCGSGKKHKKCCLVDAGV